VDRDESIVHDIIGEIECSLIEKRALGDETCDTSWSEHILLDFLHNSCDDFWRGSHDIEQWISLAIVAASSTPNLIDACRLAHRGEELRRVIQVITEVRNLDASNSSSNHMAAVDPILSVLDFCGQDEFLYAARKPPIQVKYQLYVSQLQLIGLGRLTAFPELNFLLNVLNDLSAREMSNGSKIAFTPHRSLHIFTLLTKVYSESGFPEPR
jgi:hypothetical protein